MILERTLSFLFRVSTISSDVSLAITTQTHVFLMGELGSNSVLQSVTVCPSTGLRHWARGKRDSWGRTDDETSNLKGGEYHR